MQKNHSADRSIEQRVDRLTKDLDLTPEQQQKVRQLSNEHNDRIQKILETAPPTFTYEAFNAQVHAISQEYHDAVNAILTPHQLELMRPWWAVCRTEKKTATRPRVAVGRHD